MKITQKEYEKFKEIIVDIISKDNFKRMKEIKQHRYSNCYKHSIDVATRCYIYAIRRNIKVDLVSLVRGALLHDFYLYDWRENKRKHFFHGFKHPRIALENAKKEFGPLNKIEEDIILSHMWPMTLFRFPKYKESFLVCFNDKICAINEIFVNK
jgi:uncharacterized protein